MQGLNEIVGGEGEDEIWINKSMGSERAEGRLGRTDANHLLALFRRWCFFRWLAQRAPFARSVLNTPPYLSSPLNSHSPTFWLTETQAEKRHDERARETLSMD